MTAVDVPASMFKEILEAQPGKSLPGRSCNPYGSMNCAEGCVSRVADKVFSTICVSHALGRKLRLDRVGCKEPLKYFPDMRWSLLIGKETHRSHRLCARVLSRPSAFSSLPFLSPFLQRATQGVIGRRFDPSQQQGHRTSPCREVLICFSLCLFFALVAEFVQVGILCPLL